MSILKELEATDRSVRWRGLYLITLFVLWTVAITISIYTHLDLFSSSLLYFEPIN